MFNPLSQAERIKQMKQTFKKKLAYSTISILFFSNLSSTIVVFFSCFTRYVWIVKIKTTKYSFFFTSFTNLFFFERNWRRRSLVYQRHLGDSIMFDQSRSFDIRDEKVFLQVVKSVADTILLDKLVANDGGSFRKLWLSWS